jgi:hypothetical protein
MTLRSNFSRWLISMISVAQGAFFFLIAYWAYGFDRAFHAQWLARNLIQNATFLFAGALSLAVGYFVFVRREWGKYLAATLFGGVIVWFLSEVLAEKPLEPLSLLWLLPPTIALGFLVAGWRNEASPTENLA